MNAAYKLATAEQVAKAYGVSIAYTYKMASLHQWRRVRLGRIVHYHWDDVGKTLGK